MSKVLVTGGAGFVGTHLVSSLLRGGTRVVVFDKLNSYPEPSVGKKITYVKGNIINTKDVEKLFKDYGPFETVYHLASEMPNKLANDTLMYQANVDGTVNVAKAAAKYNTKSFIYTSSNVTYGIPHTLPVDEKTPLHPLEAYGKSKMLAEKELEKIKNMNIQIFRCPVITGVGRVGLQAILYEFISENKKVYVLGGGKNKYQFVDVEDVVRALEIASKAKGFDIYTIGADEVLSLRELYERVIEYAGSKSKVVSLPAGPAFLILSILDKINFSPLGVYQVTMMGRSIYSDTKKLKTKLKWKPLKTNADTFIENYKWYIKNKGSFATIGGSEHSPNRSVPKMGILKLVKKFS